MAKRKLKKSWTLSYRKWISDKRSTFRRPVTTTQYTLEESMFSWALTFFIVAIIAGALGLSGIAGTLSSIAYLCFVIGLVLAIIFFITGKRPSV